jgi:hypothetical protein
MVDLHGERKPRPERGRGRSPPLQQHEIQVREPPQRTCDHDGEHLRILLQRACERLSRPPLLKQGDFWFSPSSFFVWI